MIFHENCKLADNSHALSFLIFSETNLTSFAVVIGTLRVKGHVALANTLIRVIVIQCEKIASQRTVNKCVKMKAVNKFRIAALMRTRRYW